MTPSITFKSFTIGVKTIVKKNKSAASKHNNFNALSKCAIAKDELQKLKGGEESLVIQEEIIGG